MTDPRPVSTPDFDAHSLPWVDRESFENELDSQTLDEDETDRLRSWRRDGFLHLSQVFASEQIDRLLADYEKAWQSRSGLYALVEGMGIVPLSAVPPRDQLSHHHFRILDLHDTSEVARSVMLEAQITHHLNLIFGQTPVAMQSLFFEYPSEQRGHQDFAYVQPEVLSHLVGVWVACEDVDQENGPLFYYRSSHRLPKYDWGDGRLTYADEGPEAIAAFENHLQQACEDAGLERLTFAAKKGDVLLWHAALVHGGSPVVDPQRTRKSFVVHYSTTQAYPRDQRVRQLPPRVVSRNGAKLYQLGPLARMWLALKLGVGARLRRSRG